MKKVIAILIALLVIVCAYAVAEEAACDHDYKIKVVSKGSCTENEWSAEVCSKCGYENDRWVSAEANGHNYVFEEKSAATCTEAKKMAEVCSKCGYVNDSWSEGEALGHNNDTLVPGFAATCTKAGLTDGYNCSRCGAVQVAQKEIAALGHDYEKYDVVKPTANRRGYTEYKCNNCGDTYRANYKDKLVVTETVAAEAASTKGYGDIVTDADDNVKPYTAEVDKAAKHVCIVAGNENGAFALRELHLSLELIAELKADGIEEICFKVGEAEIVVPFASFEGEIMETVKADFPATLTGYIVTLDPTAQTADGAEGCLVKVDMTADTKEADGIEVEITGVMTGMTLVLGETEIAVEGGAIYTA